MPDPRISNTGSGLPSRVVFHGTEGIGKTSFAAFAPKPVFGMTRGETGLLTLLDNGLVPATDHFDEFQSWGELTGAVRYLLGNGRENRTFVLDTINGAERLCFEHVCESEFNGRWESFGAYGRGPEIAQAEWNSFLSLLDKLRAKKRMAIILLCHTKVKPFRNPLGDDYDRYTPDMHDKFWGLVAKWADIILFGNFDSQAMKKDKTAKAKASGGTRRVLYTSRTAAYDAKNRVGLPEQISLGSRPEEGWRNFLEGMKRSRPAPVAANPAPAANGNGAPANAPQPTANRIGKKTLALINDLRLSPTEKEDYCAMFHVHNLDELSEADAQNLICDWEDTHRQPEEQPEREAGVDAEE